MIDFFFEDVNIPHWDEVKYGNWMSQILVSEQRQEGFIEVSFCTDEVLLTLNKSYMNHDTYTDIITLDYSVAGLVHAQLHISLERVADNAEAYEVSFDDELQRVLAHGLLHLCGFSDGTDDERIVMRQKENDKLKMFHVEQ